MDGIVENFNKFAGWKGKRDDDFFDRLSSRYTVTLLLVFAAVVTFYQFGAAPVVCWFPVHFTGSHQKYATTWCWIKNTYYLPYGNEIPKAHEEDLRQDVIYYQWIPFILLVQALFFYFPSIIWHAFNSKAGVDSDNILASANMLRRIDKEEGRQNLLNLVTRQMHRFLGSRRQFRTMGGSRIKQMLTCCCHMCGRRFGSFLTGLYIFSKILYIANILFQLHFLNLVLNMPYNTYGYKVLTSWASDTNWHDSPHTAFPRVTMCDFNVRRLGNLHRYTVQCALPLNLFNEKIYVFLWFWFVFVLVCSILGTITWLARVCAQRDRILFVKNHIMHYNDIDNEKTSRKVFEFVSEYLQQDGAFVLRLIAHNTNNITTSEIVTGLWEKFLEGRNKDPLPVRPTNEEDIDQPDSSLLLTHPKAKEAMGESNV